VAFEGRQQIAISRPTGKRTPQHCIQDVYGGTRIGLVADEPLKVAYKRTGMLRKLSLLVLVGVTGLVIPVAKAADWALKISIPKRGKLTPVQRLNREGVEAVQKNQLEKSGVPVL